MTATELSILTLNVGAAARERAEQLLRWLAGRDDDVVLLTETSAGAGTAFLLDQFLRAGYAVVQNPGVPGDRGVALVSRVAVAAPLTAPFAEVSLPGRVAAAVLDTQPPIAVVGVYVPSRDRSLGKIEKKQTFITSLLAALGALPAELRAGLVVGGDYNVIGRSHQPRHRGFLPFEFGLLDTLHEYGLVDAHDHGTPGGQPYSWIGRTGDGYRYDYLHVSAELAGRVAGCTYLHEPRLRRLTDHAGVTLDLTADRIARRPVSVPGSAAAAPLF